MKSSTKNSRVVPSHIPLALLLIILVSIFATGAAQAAGNTLVGSWQVKDDNSPAMFFATFHRDETYTVAASSRETSEAHGVWKNSNANTADTTDFAFIYDSTSGNVLFKQKTQAKVTLGADRQSLTAVLVITIQQLDGTVIQTINTTVTGTRILVDPIP